MTDNIDALYEKAVSDVTVSPYQDASTSYPPAPPAPAAGVSTFEQNVRRITNDLADLLIAKNAAYGDSALNPVRVFSKASPVEQLLTRIDDKISRIQRGGDFGDEDTVKDLVGYLVLLMIAREAE